MSSSFRTCLDGHRCENGSSCLQHPLEEGTYFCDCTTASGDFAGLFCEYEAETYCQLEQETSSTWFCVNQGTCVLESSGSAKYKCNCPEQYEGPVSRNTVVYECSHQWRSLVDFWAFPHFNFLSLRLSCSIANSSREMCLVIGQDSSSIQRLRHRLLLECSGTN